MDNSRCNRTPESVETVNIRAANSAGRAIPWHMLEDRHLSLVELRCQQSEARPASFTQSFEDKHSRSNYHSMKTGARSVTRFGLAS